MDEKSDAELTPDKMIIGERNYEAAIDLVLERAQQELLIFDQDLSKGAYHTIRRYELLRSFLSRGPQQRFVMVLQEAESFAQLCPRLNDLLRTYGHLMTIYQTTDHAKTAKDMFVIADQSHYVRRIHVDHARFRYGFDDLETVGMLNMRFDELLQATSHRISATGLGL